MTHDATRLMEEALKAVKLDGSFDPDRIGAKIGLRKPQAEAAARELSNAGVLVLGFDCAAHFSPDFKKARAAAGATKSGTKNASKSAVKRTPHPPRVRA